MWVGLGAAAQALIAYRSMMTYDHDPTDWRYVVASGLGAAGYYTFYRGLARVRTRYRFGPTAIRLNWQLLLTAGYLLTALFYLRHLPHEVWLLLVAAVLFAGAYAYAGHVSRALAAFGFAKPLLLAAVWTWVVCFVPSFQAGLINEQFLISRFCFFLAIGLASDYKDLDADSGVGLVTPTQRLGRKVARGIAIGLFGVSLYTGTAAGDGDSFLAAAALDVTTLLGLPLLWMAFRQNRPSELFYGFILDGLLVVPLTVYWALR